MPVIDVSSLSTVEKQTWLQHAIAPRPIAFASTINANGIANLSPFSFFNLFSSNPPIVIFSPARRVRDNTTKHTLQNIEANKEVVIGIVHKDIVGQMSLSSCEYGDGIDEFVKAGFTKGKSKLVKPFLINECLINLECIVKEIIYLGQEAGAGNLVVAEVKYIHVEDSILNEDKTQIDQTKINHVARLGGDWYAEVNTTNLFTLPKPNKHNGIGFDNLPQSVLNTKYLSNNQKAALANIEKLPEIIAGFSDENTKNIFQYFNLEEEVLNKELFLYAAKLINNNEIEKAWQVIYLIE